jgi:hypothetical protein
MRAALIMTLLVACAPTRTCTTPFFDCPAGSFAPGARVQLFATIGGFDTKRGYVEVDGRVIRVATTGVELTFTLPSDLSAGDHTLTVYGEDAQGGCQETCTISVQ